MTRHLVRYRHTATVPGNHQPSAALLGGPATGFVGTTTQLTLRRFQPDGSYIDGNTAAMWASSNPLVASVTQAGLVTYISAGTATISATVDGQAITALATSVTPLVTTIDLAPIISIAELGDPHVFVSRASLGGNGERGTTPVFFGSTLFGNSRIAYPRSASQFDYVSPNISQMPNSGWEPQNYGPAPTLVPNGGPFDNTSCYAFAPNDLTNNYISWGLKSEPGSFDHDDVSSYKRGYGLAIKADPAHPEDIGKQVYFDLALASLLGGSYPAGYVAIVRQTITLTADWQFVGQDVLNHTQWDNGSGDSTRALFKTLPGGAAHFYAATFGSFLWHAHGDPREWYRQLPFHATLGILSQFEGKNVVTGDNGDHPLYGGASKAVSIIPGPFDGAYHGGRPMNLYTVPVAGGFTVSTSEQFEELSDVFPSNIPVERAFVGVYIKPGPAQPIVPDGALAVYFDVPSGPTYGPFPLSRDTAAVMRAIDGAAYYRIQNPTGRDGGAINNPLDIILGESLGGQYRITTSAPHGLVAGNHVYIRDHSAVAPNDYTIASATATTMTFNGDPGFAGVGGRVHRTQLLFNVRIQNVSAGALQFYAADTFATPEGPRTAGHDSMVVAKRTVTAPLYNEAAFVIIARGEQLITVDQGFWLLRSIWRAPAGAVRLKQMRGGLALWQSGENGSADHNFDAAFSWNDTGPYLLVQCARGSPGPTIGYKAFTMIVQWTADDLTLFPDFVDFDIGTAWHISTGFGRLYIGHGAGSAPLEELKHGDTWRGGAVSIVLNDGTDWNLADGGDPKIAILSDRDKTRQPGGWWNYLVAGKTLPVASTMLASLSLQIQTRAGARRDLR